MSIKVWESVVNTEELLELKGTVEEMKEWCVELENWIEYYYGKWVYIINDKWVTNVKSKFWTIVPQWKISFRLALYWTEFRVTITILINVMALYNNNRMI